MTYIPRPKRPTTSLCTRNVPVSVRDLFKAYCARRGYTMEASIIALMKKAVKDDMRLPDARKEK